ncbi:MAG: hypothetical protein KatS3mg082_3039 [Nitrospiraceae bacterium]|nr:MAG: hypothetical protein KatS3mg082_3039 [Nitrospiraceae bacterium]
MTASSQVLPVIALPGLRLEVLGNYLASLGLLRVLARRWRSVRIAWRDGVLHVVGGPPNLDQLLQALGGVALQRDWTPYLRAWKAEQQKATNKQSGLYLAVWRGNAEERFLELFDAHDVPLARVVFNPLLGSGGNAGRRDFAAGWRLAVDKLQTPPKGVDALKELQAWLLGQPTSWLLAGIAAASWFSSANKLYNSGQGPYREEGLSPWAMALACEGLGFLAGSASRRLGARARAQAAFPFVCQPAAPITAGELGRDRGELWAPIWQRPMTVPEVRALFQRGRAEVRGRGAVTPAAFAAAIVRRGVDAGVVGFARFSLGATTSANTFEPRHQGIIPVRLGATTEADRVRSEAVEQLVTLVERLPEDRRQGDRWQFVGLRGPIEAALIRVAQAPDDPAALCELLDAVVFALDRVDRNISHRKRRVRWQPLPLGILPSLLGNGMPGLEARLAIALVSAFPPSCPFALYRFGIEERFGSFEHPERPPARWVHSLGSLPRWLADIVFRSVLDWENSRTAGTVWGGLTRLRPLTVSAADVQAWLGGDVDEALLAQWLGRCALLDWRRGSEVLCGLWSAAAVADWRPDSALLLTGLFQPLFDGRPLRLNFGWEVRNVLSGGDGARTPGAARTIASLIRTGQIDAAIRVAGSRYAMADVPLVRTGATWCVSAPERLLAAVLFPLAERDRTALVERWLRPQREKGGYSYV